MDSMIEGIIVATIIISKLIILSMGWGTMERNIKIMLIKIASTTSTLIIWNSEKLWLNQKKTFLLVSLNMIQKSMLRNLEIHRRLKTKRLKGLHLIESFSMVCCLSNRYIGMISRWF
jgi:hypothetical protein